MGTELKSLFEISNIYSIYIIDDAREKANVDIVHFISLVNKIRNSVGIEKLDSIDNELAFEDNESILEEYCRNEWAKAKADRRLEIIAKLVSEAPQSLHEDSDVNLNISGPIKQLQQEQGLNDTELLELTPIEWKAQRDTIISSIPEGKRVLLLFDQVLDQAGPEFIEIKGIDLINELLQNTEKSKFVAGLLTYTVHDESFELEEREKMVKGYSISSKELFVLTKKRLQNVSHMVDGIKKMLLNEPCEFIKHKAIEIGKAAFEETSQKLMSLDTYDFNKTVLQSSALEGIWAPETLFRIIDIIYKDEIKRNMLTNSITLDFNSMLSKATEISSVEISIAGEENYNAKYALRQQEIYQDATIVNGLYKPIGNGDIFEVYNGTQKGLYILLSQPCDIAVRSGGDRSAKYAYLFKIAKKNIEELRTMIETVRKSKDLLSFDYWKTRSAIEYIDSNPNILGVVNFLNARIIDLNALDLVSFNKDGNAVFNNTISDTQFLPTGLSNLFLKVQKHYKKALDGFDTFNTEIKDLKSDVKDKLMELKLPSLSMNDKLGKTEFDGTKLSFGIRRVKSLREPFSAKLLEKYTKFLSRDAELHDFTKHKLI